MQTDSLFLCGEIGHKQIEIDIERKKERKKYECNRIRVDRLFRMCNSDTIAFSLCVCVYGEKKQITNSKKLEQKRGKFLDIC